MRQGEKGLPLAVQLSSETRHQRDLCTMAIEPDADIPLSDEDFTALDAEGHKAFHSTP
ncbi:hypothetical protein AtDm6_1329 [Acetobacter tropicalis]|uniref:Uncharacterized protein n=1 Tax=Acetobacter tropicalis TaxID=104102 RepID=A0A094YUA8_9PROT|nr:hypothetical protein AtDm6_1329 [Acetobacter tropicalis]